MGKKKISLSLFSTLVQQTNEPTNECHLIDNEYIATFNTVDDMQRFHEKVTSNEQANDIEQQDMDMKTFAQQYLVDLPENCSLSNTSSQEIFHTDQSINWSPKVKDKKRKSTTPVKLNNKRQRRNLQDLSQLNNDYQNSVNTSTNIFASLQDNISTNDSTISAELAEPSTVKPEPIESDEQLIVKTKQEPMEINMTSANPMAFGTSAFSGDLDNYVQNIHLLHEQTSRPKRIRKQKKFFMEENELITRPKKRKKRQLLPQVSSTFSLTDAEIEQQFGELLPLIKTEHDENTLQTIDNHVIMEFEPIINHQPQTPIEKARAKLTNALGRGHEPDAYSLKIRSREHKIIEVQLAIYSTADWYSHRTKILSKIEEALRGLRVSWTKIDIRVDEFDIKISTSCPTSNMTPPSSISNTNSSWFLKILSESNPLIVHIHDRRYPQQRLLIKCSCPECSRTNFEPLIDSSLPVIVNVSPATTPKRPLNRPSILNKTSPTNISSLHNIATTFFNELIAQCGRSAVISVTQCVLDLTLIVSVYTSLPNLCVSPSYSKDEYKDKYQQIIDPLKCTHNDNEQMLLSKNSMIPRLIPIDKTQPIIGSKSSDITKFYDLIKQNKANIRSAKSMRNLITIFYSSPATSPTQSNSIKTRTLILPNSTASVLPQSNSSKYNYNTNKQQPLCTPIIELKPIHTFPRENQEKILIQTSQNHQITTFISKPTDCDRTASSLSNSARVIRLSIAKSAQPSTNLSNSTSSPTIRLISSPQSDSDTNSLHSNKNEPVPLVPKQINIIKPLSSSSTITPAIKLSNPVLISSNISQQPSTK